MPTWVKNYEGFLEFLSFVALCAPDKIPERRLLT